MIKEEILELIEQCEKEIKNKEKFNDIESTTVKYARKIDQKLMQHMVNIKGTGHVGREITLEDGTKAKFKEYDKKNF